MAHSQVMDTSINYMHIHFLFFFCPFFTAEKDSKEVQKMTHTLEKLTVEKEKSATSKFGCEETLLACLRYIHVSPKIEFT